MTMSAVLGTLGRRAVAGHVALVVVAVVGDVDEGRAGGFRAAAALLADGEAGEAEALVDAAEGIADVIELGNDGVLNFRESNDESDHDNGRNEDKLSGDDKSRFVLKKRLEHCSTP